MISTTVGSTAITNTVTKKRHKILILKFPFSSTFGGGEKHTITLVDNLRQQHDFYLLSTCKVLLKEFHARRWPTKTIWAGTEPVTIKTLLLFFITAPFILLNLLRYLIYYKNNYQVDTIFCLSLTEKILLTPWAKLLGINVIWMEHLQIERWLLSSPLRIPYVWWSHLVTITTVVKAVKTQLINIGVPEKNITVIYNSVDTTTFTPSPSNPDKIKQQFKLLFIGRLATEKGIDDLLQAVAQLRATIPNFNLTLVGDGYWRTALENLAKTLNITDKINFVGFQKDIAPWLQQSDVLILPATRRETFGIVTIEALAMVKPVIATTIGGLPEIVNDSGWLVPPHQPAALAKALLEVYNNYSLALDKAQNGRQRILELFQEKRMIQLYDELFSHN